VTVEATNGRAIGPIGDANRPRGSGIPFMCRSSPRTYHPCMRPSSRDSTWAETWQASWDRLEERYVPDREVQIDALLDVIDAAVARTPAILDLGSGTGTLTRRFLDRWPDGRAVALDVDPVLLAIASATFVGDDRVQVVAADLRDARWIGSLPHGRFDAIVTTTALHWLPEQVVRRLYGDAAALLEPGCLFAHAEAMPLAGLPRLGPALADVKRRRRTSCHPEAGPSWDDWWRQVAEDPRLRPAAEARQSIFLHNYPEHEFCPPAEWHLDTLLDAGFREVGVVWRSGASAIVAALR